MTSILFHDFLFFIVFYFYEVYIPNIYDPMRAHENMFL